MGGLGGRSPSNREAGGRLEMGGEGLRADAPPRKLEMRLLPVPGARQDFPQMTRLSSDDKTLIR